jgi:hypothetical protein
MDLLAGGPLKRKANACNQSFPVILLFIRKVAPSGARRTMVTEGIDRNGRSQLYMRPLTAAGFTPIPGTEGVNYMFWSPDSRWIAFILKQDAPTSAVRPRIEARTVGVPQRGPAPGVGGPREGKPVSRPLSCKARAVAVQGYGPSSPTGGRV